MRSLLILFLTASAMDGGWEWSRENASSLFGSYVGLVYLSTMLGGYFADKIIGFRWAVVVGAVLMTLGHASMAVETEFSIYLGLVLLVFGNGFFKPNMTSIISEMYKDRPEKRWELIPYFTWVSMLALSSVYCFVVIWAKKWAGVTVSVWPGFLCSSECCNFGYPKTFLETLV